MMPPFIIFSMPRARSAWLAEFLTYKDWQCCHEVAIHLRSIEEMRALLFARNVGYAETAAAPAWPLLRHYQPELRCVVVHRPIEDSVTAMIDAGRRCGVSYDRGRLRAMIAYGERCLAKISASSGALTIAHNDLGTRDGCHRVFEFCLPYRFDEVWWSEWRDRNVQVDLRSFFGFYQSNKQGIEKFKTACRRELFRLRRSGELRRA